MRGGAIANIIWRQAHGLESRLTDWMSHCLKSAVPLPGEGGWGHMPLEEAVSAL